MHVAGSDVLTAVSEDLQRRLVEYPVQSVVITLKALLDFGVQPSRDLLQVRLLCQPNTTSTLGLLMLFSCDAFVMGTALQQAAKLTFSFAGLLAVPLHTKHSDKNTLNCPVGSCSSSSRHFVEPCQP